MVTIEAAVAGQQTGQSKSLGKNGKHAAEIDSNGIRQLRQRGAWPAGFLCIQADSNLRGCHWPH